MSILDKSVDGAEEILRSLWKAGDAGPVSVEAIKDAYAQAYGYLKQGVTMFQVEEQVAITRDVAVLAAAREVVRRLYHRHADRDGNTRTFGPGGCYSSTYEPCGEHHAHDMQCGGYWRHCDRAESDPSVNALRDALLAFEAAVKGSP